MTPGRGVDDGVEELLDTGSRSRVGVAALTVVALAAVAGVVLALSRAGHGSPSGRFPPPAPPRYTGSISLPTVLTGNDVLDFPVAGGSRVTSMPLGGNQWVVVAAADLTNFSNHRLVIDEPIAVAGRGESGAVIVESAEITATRNASATEPPPLLTRIQANQNVDVWIRLRVDCNALRAQDRSLSGMGVIISLSGLPPAIFEFGDLFGIDPGAQQPPCGGRPH